jgi:hypothetical protein
MGFVPLRADTAWRGPRPEGAGTATGTAPQREESAEGYEACGQNYRLGAGRTVQDTAGPEHLAGVLVGLPADSIFWGGTGCQSRIRTRGPRRGSHSRRNHPHGVRPSSGTCRSRPTRNVTRKGTHRRPQPAAGTSRSGGRRRNGALTSPATTADSRRGVRPIPRHSLPPTSLVIFSRVMFSPVVFSRAMSPRQSPG